jgi:hypothetical protein
MSMAYSGLDDEPEPEKSSANNELMCESEIPAQFKRQSGVSQGSGKIMSDAGMLVYSTP